MKLAAFCRIFCAVLSVKSRQIILTGISKGSIPFALGDPTGMRAPCWPEESKETGGFVAHDFAGKVSCVIPFADADAGKGWLRELPALSGGGRTGGVWVPTLRLFVWRRCRESAPPGLQKGYITRCSDVLRLLKKSVWFLKQPFHSCVNERFVSVLPHRFDSHCDYVISYQKKTAHSLTARAGCGYNKGRKVATLPDGL